MNSREALEHPVVVASMKVCRMLSASGLPTHADLFQQMERASLSVGSNWMEGIGRRGTAKSSQSFYRIARGSGYELAFQAAFAELKALLEEIHVLCDLMDHEIGEAVVVE